MPDIKSINFPPPIADDMVRAILEDRKTVTRRVVKPQPKENEENPHCVISGSIYFDVPDKNFGGNLKSVGPYKPPYRPSDILYVRETWCHIFGRYVYRADFNEITEEAKVLFRPSIHMPREAVRIFLRVTDVRVERLQGITDDDALSEGVQYTDFGTYQPSWEMSLDGGKTFHAAKEAHYPGYHVGTVDTPDKCYPTARGAFHALWNSTIKPANRALYGWDANPWVWVIKFERISREELKQDV